MLMACNKLTNSLYKSYCIVFSTSVTTVNSFQVCVMNSFNSARYAELGGKVVCEGVAILYSIVSCASYNYCALTSCTFLHGFVGHV